MAEITPDSADSPLPLSAADELQLAERLISFDTSHIEGIKSCVGYLTGWLEARDIPNITFDVHGAPVLAAAIGEGPITIVLHAHVDVVPGSSDQFIPWRDKEFLWGRGAYDMKGATAAMFAVMSDLAALPPDQRLPIKVRLVVVPDEESDEEKEEHGTEVAVERGHVGDFVICGEPTDLHVGVQAKGVLDVRIDVEGESAHGATPWLGVNAISKAMDVFDHLLLLPFAHESSTFFDRPSINLARINSGGRLNQVPEHCTMEVDIRYLPEQPVERIKAELRSLPGCSVREIVSRPPAKVSMDNPFLQTLKSSVTTTLGHDIMCVGRDGTNDGVYFLKRGIPSVEFGPIGGGHHGPHEKVSIKSLHEYRLSLLHFLHAIAMQGDSLIGVTVPSHLEEQPEPRSLL